MASKRNGFFTPAFFAFLNDLKANNDRAWFQANKGRYEASVQEPAVAFMAAMGTKLKAISPHMVADARPFGGSMSRIYRDTRFSKDKSPYNTHVGIHFSHDASKGTDTHLPGLYLHLGLKDVGVYSGVWRPEARALKEIRDAIVARSADWKKATKAPVKLWGESLKRPPPGYDPEHPLVEDLKRKDFIGHIELKESDVVGPGFATAFLAAGKKLDPLNRFLAKAMKVPW